MAGINAHLKIQEEDPFILGRSEAYIGVLIDDLVTKGVDEPYRMFTSRAEHRILLRQDNADTRLTERAYRLGLASKERYQKMLGKKFKVEELKKFLFETSIKPAEINKLLEEENTPGLNQKVKMASVLLRPQVNLQLLEKAHSGLQEFIRKQGFTKEEIESAEIQVKYEGYIQKEQEIAIKLSKFDNIKLKPDFNYDQLKSISFEAREKLSKIRPKTIGQASRISGVSPSDINVLLIFLGR